MLNAVPAVSNPLAGGGAGRSGGCLASCGTAGRLHECSAVWTQLAYAAVLLAASGHLVPSPPGAGGGMLLGALVAAFATVHVTWSFGFGLNLVFWRRWPRWGQRGHARDTSS